MKEQFRKIFAPVLKPFEKGEGEYAYKPLNRKILLVLGSLFFLLASGVTWAVVSFSQWGAFLPVVIFYGVALVCLIVGSLGSDRAVSNIWGSQGRRKTG